MNSKSLLASLLLFAALPNLPAAADANELTPELADRYELMLIRSPQPGSAFDRVIEWYSTKGGGLEVLQKRWWEAAAQGTNKQAYLIAQGLLAERLRTPDAARKLYQEAITQGDPTPAARLLAALETAEGRFPDAAKAYEQALATESLVPVDRMELMRAQALLYQRAFDDEKALAVWREAIKRFPTDPYVLEEAGEAFLATARYDEARVAFTKLQELSARDPYRKIAASLRLGRTAELEGKPEEAVRLYDQALGETSEGSWINREVRGRIEDLFRGRDDLPGLLAYYEKRTTAVPQDFLAFANLAGVLKDLQRSNESVDALRKATQLAPGDSKLRTALIRQLTDLGRPQEALTAAEELAKPASADPDAILLLGNLQWQQFAATQKDEDRLAALKTWRRIAPEDTTDVARVAQLAELLASHRLTDEAVEEWKRVIRLEPGATDARQQIAAVEVKRGQVDTAKKLLTELVEGDRGTAENYVKLSKLQTRMEWPNEAKQSIQQGLEKFPKDFDLLSLAWQQALEGTDSAAIDALLPRIWASAPNDFFAEEVIKRYASQIETQGKPVESIQQLRQRTEANPADAIPAMVLFRLALSQKDEAAAKQALALLQGQPNAVRAARAGADLAQTFGNPKDQVAALQAVAIADPRMAADSLRAVAKIQAGAGEVPEALATLSGLIERSPADASLYTLYADLAVRAGKYDEAISRLRDSLRFVEDATHLRLQLAGYLQAQGQSSAAAEMLQEAFTREEKNTRRMDIFRRQIELAQQTGKIDDLIASLRDRQSKEQGGARYGVYLAEIFTMQGDYLAAKEELTRSLGKNPDNATAVARLIDLADRGGDREESRRLSARLVELEPSQENQSAHLAKMLNDGESEAAGAVIQSAWAEIIKNPTAWNSVIMAMAKAGLREQSDRLIDEISASSKDPEVRSTVAWLRLMQGNYPAAESELWRVAEAGSLAESLEAVTGPTPTYQGYGASRFWVRSQPLQQIMGEVQNSIQTNLMPGRRGSSRTSYAFRSLAPTATATTAQREQLRAIFLLSQLARAASQEEAFFKRLRSLLERESVNRSLQFSLLSLLNDGEGLRELIELQAKDPNPDLTVDRLVMDLGGSRSKQTSESVAIIRARVEKSDPAFSYQQLFSNNIQTISQFYRSGRMLPEEKKPEAKKLLEELLNHPGRKENPQADVQLASFAAMFGEVDRAIQLLDESEKAALANPPANLPPQVISSQFYMARAGIAAAAIRNDDPKAQELFENWLKSVSAGSANSPNTGASIGIRSLTGYGYSSSPLLNSSPELIIGDSELPIRIFQIFNQSMESRADLNPMQSWFAARVTEGKMDAYQAGLFYLDWFGGKKNEAIKRIEALQATNPSPRTAALLLEAYEKSKNHEKALALIDQAEMQDTETPEVREIRRIRLLRQAGKNQEAGQAAEKLGRSRLSTNARNILTNELRQLGITTPNPANLNPSRNRSSRPTQNREEMVRLQVNKLIEDKKVDEAQRIARLELDKPLPGVSDNNAVHQRRNLISQLRQMGRLEQLESNLLDHLEKDPGDVDAALRLVEASSEGDNQPAIDRLAATIQQHPERLADISPLIALMQMQSNSRPRFIELVINLLKLNPALFAVNDFDFNQFVSLANESKNKTALAETVANLDEEGYRKLFFRNRLMGQMQETGMVSQLAEALVPEGKTEAAIKLLQRGLSDSGRNPEIRLGIVLRLAELQLTQGNKAEAAAAMQLLFAEKTSTYSPFSNQMPLRDILINQLMNRPLNEGQEQQLAKIARLANDTGTLDLLLTQLDQPNPVSGMIPPGLLIRTHLKKPGIEKEWKELVTKKSGGLQNLSLPMLTTALQSVSAQPNPKPLVLALLQSQKDNSNAQFGGGDTSLRYLMTALPLLAPYRTEPVVQAHIEKMIDSAMKDPNAANYFINSSAYIDCLKTLMESGLAKDARKLFQFTAAERMNRNTGNQEIMNWISARIKLALGEEVETQMLCAGFPMPDGSLKVHWTTGLRVDDPNPNSGRRVGWDDSNLEIPAAQRAVQLEIWAGPNPAALEKIAQLDKPKSRGSTSAKVTAPFGILQAKWKLRDGSTHWGPLTAYVVGQNQIENHGIPEKTLKSLPPESFRSGQPGPLGPESAVTVSALYSQSQITIPLLQLPSDKTPGLTVFTGWSRGENSQRQPPRFGMLWTREDGNTNREEFYNGQVIGGQWSQFVKVWSTEMTYPNASNLQKDLKQAELNVTLSSSMGYNMQYPIGGSWAGLQYVKLAADLFPKEVSALINQANEAFRLSDYVAAVDGYLTAIRANPKDALRGDSNRLFQAFEKANRLPELYSILSAPALYLPNPIRENQPTLREEGLISLLAREAIKPDASDDAKKWLSGIERATLPEAIQFLIDSSLFREKLKQDPNQFSSKRLLEILGWVEAAPNLTRIGRLWQLDQTNAPTRGLLQLFDTPEKRTEALALLKNQSLPPEYLASQRLLEAWLLAPDSPAEAINLWKQSANLRRSGPNSVSTGESTDRELLTQIAATQYSPGDLVANLRDWLSQSGRDPASQNSFLSDFLYGIQKTSIPRQKDYAALWMDTELASLKAGQFNGSQERIVEAVKRLQANEDWERLAIFLGLAENVPALKNSPALATFFQMRSLISFSRGDLTVAWPVSWCSPGTQSQNVTAHWQWNLKKLNEEKGIFDSTVSIADREIRSTIPGQSAIEIWFGEMPNDLQLLKRIEGDLASGQAEVQLPTPNGFLRTIAVFADKRVAGPLTPVLSGRRVFPVDGLKNLLLSGADPLAAEEIAEEGTAPDGSPAIRIGTKGQSKALGYVGPEIPVEAGKFYVLRNWMHRSGNGGYADCVEYRPVKDSKAGSLSMILSEQPDVTDQWVLMTRAVPVIPQHTFWIPFKEVDRALPRFWDAAPGTQIAGWELLEITNWKYGQWLTELALLREQAGKEPSAADVNRALELATLEPLTSLDYHGSWLAEQLARTGQSEKLIPLYQAAMTAEVNPLFSRPKLNRVFGSMTSLIDNPACPNEVRWKLIEMAAANSANFSVPQRLGFKRRQLEVAKAMNREPETRAALVTELNRMLDDPKSGPKFLLDTIQTRAYRADRPVNDLASLCLLLNNSDLNRRILKEITNGSLATLDGSKRKFLELTLNVYLSGVPDEEEWKRQLSRAFASTDKLSASEDFMFWPAILGDALLALNAPPSSVLELRQQAFERTLKLTRNPEVDMKERIRAAEYFLEACVQSANPERAAKTAQTLATSLAKYLGNNLPMALDSNRPNVNLAKAKPELSDDSLRMILRSMDSLTALGDTNNAQALLKLIRDQVEKRPAIKDTFLKYLTAPVPTPEATPANPS